MNFLQIGDEVHLPGLLCHFTQQPAVTNDCIERRSEFVANIGQKLAFGQI